MSDPAMGEIEQSLQPVLLRKRGLYYRVDWAGYTSNIAEAGTYERWEAEKHVAKTEGVTIMEIST